MWNDWHAERAS